MILFTNNNGEEMGVIMPKNDGNIKDLYYVYEHRLDGKVIYVGKGTGYRAINPDRNVYWRALVGERVDEVNVVIKAYFEDEIDAFMYESILIDRYISEDVKLTNIAMNSNVHEDYSYLEEIIKEVINKEAKDKLKRVMSLFIKDETPIELKIMRRNESLGLIDELLGRDLTTADKNELASKLGVKRDNGKLVKWNAISEAIKNNGYKVEDKRIRVDGKQIRVSVITK